MQNYQSSGKRLTNDVVTFNTRTIFYDPYAGGLIPTEIPRTFDCRTKEFISKSGQRRRLKSDDYNGFDIVSAFCKTK